MTPEMRKNRRSRVIGIIGIVAVTLLLMILVLLVVGLGLRFYFFSFRELDPNEALQRISRTVGISLSVPTDTVRVMSER